MTFAPVRAWEGLAEVYVPYPSQNWSHSCHPVVSLVGASWLHFLQRSEWSQIKYEKLFVNGVTQASPNENMPNKKCLCIISKFLLDGCVFDNSR